MNPSLSKLEAIADPANLHYVDNPHPTREVLHFQYWPHSAQIYSLKGTPTARRRNPAR